MIPRVAILWCLTCAMHVLWLLLPMAACSAAVQATLYVAPNGSDENPGSEAKPFATIEKARQAVLAINKEMIGDIVVVLRGGTYKLSKTLSFDHRDSGCGGHTVIYKAYSGETPVLSGGRTITGWQADADGRWRAKTDLKNFRQLYVDGQRAVRARGDAPSGMELFGENGYKTTAVEMAGWKNQADIEFCYYVVWCHTSCKVQSIKRDGERAIVAMLQPYFTHARKKEGVKVKLPNYVENAFELLDEPGEWYFDRSADTVYYIPKPGQDMTKARVVVPAIEKLVELHGTLDHPVANLQFVGITFSHADWLTPSRIGLADIQANFVLNWKESFERDGGINAIHNQHIKSPANVVCRAAKQVRFHRCTFTKLGGAGLDIEFGSQDNVASGCHFYDISGTAVQVGDVRKDDHHPDDPRKVVKNNTVANNYIHDCCVEYKGGVGVCVGYTDGTVIAHNEICSLPYMRVSRSVGGGVKRTPAAAIQYTTCPTNTKHPHRRKAIASNTTISITLWKSCEMAARSIPWETCREHSSVATTSITTPAIPAGFIWTKAAGSSRSRTTQSTAFPHPCFSTIALKTASPLVTNTTTGLENNSPSPRNARMLLTKSSTMPD